MMKRIVFFILFLYFLALFQTSFLVHFKILGMVPNLVLIAVILINIFTPYYQWQGIGLSLLGGFYLDLFSLSCFGPNYTCFFGFYTLVFLLIALFVKFIFKRHVQFSK